MPTISIVAFRGLAFSDETPLIRTGHVALGGVFSNRLIGFSPTSSAIENAGGALELLKLLRAGKAQLGCLQDDTAIFVRAKELAVLYEELTVWILDVEITSETLVTIKEWYNLRKEALYNLPTRQGTFKPNEYNCATFPTLFGVSIPTQNGQMKAYIEAMIAKGARKW